MGEELLIHIPSCHFQKLELRADKTLFVGFTEDRYTYLFRNSSCPRVLQMSRDIKFFEDYFPTSMIEMSITLRLLLNL